MKDQEAFIQLIKEKEGIIYKVCRAYGRDIEDEKDLYQEIVYQLWKSYASFQGASKISTWLYRVALNTALTHSQKRKKHLKKAEVGAEFYSRFEHADQLIQERIDLMYQQIKTLNLMDKALVLLYLEGSTYQEISEIMGLSPTNVGTRLGRIKTKLKRQIQKQAI